MNIGQLLNQILPILHSVKENEEKLQKILDFLLEEIYEEPVETIFIPEKYAELVRQVADSINCGNVCFINPDTLVVEDIPQAILDERFGYEFTTDDDADDDTDSDTDDDTDDLNLEHRNWDRFIRVDLPESSESFAIMEAFVQEVKDKNLKNKLVYALSNRKPFAHFKTLIENSDYRKKWFAFKQQKLEEYVWQEIESELAD